jgi:hypothetical protein
MRRGATDPARIAQECGLRYQESGAKGFHHELGPLPGVPRGGEIKHVFTGPLDGRPVTVFQHRYVVNTGQAVIPVHHAVYTTSAPDWPVTTARPRRALSRALFRLGVRRGLMLEDDAFNGAFRLTSSDDEFALTFFHPELQAFLATKRGITWHLHPGRAAMIYGGALKLDRVPRSLERLRRFWSLVTPELQAW